MTALFTFASSMLTNDVIAYQPQIGVVQVSGVDGGKFLQGQITCDMTKLTQKQSLYGAVCNIKGRIIANFFIIQKDNHILLFMPKDLIEKTLSHFKKYAVFFKTELTDVSESYRITATYAQTTNPLPEVLTETLPTQEYTTKQDGKSTLVSLSEYPTKVNWLIEDAQNAPSLQEKNSEWSDALTTIMARPLVHARQSEETLPQWLNMQRTGGISFTKGCYTGQEIVARMQYRGKSKRQLALFTWPDQLKLNTAQAIQNDQGKAIGQLFHVAKAKGQCVSQAILNIEPSDIEYFLLDGQAISLLPTPYLLNPLNNNHSIS